ncbi:hypothetical protein WJX81_000623 [Elliptochloris bilobata]|uniref:Methyltransferase type 12 domain-containing protein n=1 Tax=Elliptochloris bilobata TaxID=381761 RepID=A0AAW1SE97_9CHLO
MLEVGCGAGNTVFPLLEANPRAFVYACDFSPRAVRLVRANQAYGHGRAAAFVADITQPHALAGDVPDGMVDVCTLIFVLSAIAPEKMPQAVRNLAIALRPGRGRVLVRDYARGDLAQDRLGSGRHPQRLAGDFFVRGDGTRAFYFTEAGLRELFEAEGFRCDDVRVRATRIENRARGLAMDRRWVQAAFTLGKAGAQAGGMDLDALFDGGAPEEVEELVDLGAALGAVRVRSVAREHRHTLAHTGLMLWEAAPALARLLLACPALCAGKRVLELGAGASPLVALAALRMGAVCVVATDGSPDALRLLEANLAANAGQVVIERARLRRLAWDDAAAVQALAAEAQGPRESTSYSRRRPAAASSCSASGFDLALGADVAYVAEAVPALFAAAAALLSASKEARLVLCHVTRRVAEERILAAAAAAGWEPAPPEAGLSAAAAHALFGPLRLLVFQRRAPAA